MEPRCRITTDVTIRPAQDADLPAIADIYNDAVLNSTATFDTEPWTPEQREQWFREHDHPYVVLVAARDGEVVGWAALSPFQRKPAYRHTAEASL